MRYDMRFEWGCWKLMYAPLVYLGSLCSPRIFDVIFLGVVVVVCRFIELKVP